MKAYIDSNIYISYLLGQRHEELIEKVLKRGIECAFTIVSSPTVFAEIHRRCGGSGAILLSKTMEDFKKAGKIIVVRDDREMDENASRLDEQTEGEFGFNDFVHTLLAAKHADILVTEDRALRRAASGFVRTVTLSEFASEVL